MKSNNYGFSKNFVFSDCSSAKETSPPGGSGWNHGKVIRGQRRNGELGVFGIPLF